MGKNTGPSAIENVIDVLISETSGKVMQLDARDKAIQEVIAQIRNVNTQQSVDNQNQAIQTILNKAKSNYAYKDNNDFQKALKAAEKVVASRPAPMVTEFKTENKVQSDIRHAQDRALKDMENNPGKKADKVKKPKAP